jgi:hypothetical protein
VKALSFIGAYDQLTAALDQLRSQIAFAEVVALSTEERAQCVKVRCIIEDIEKSLDSCNELIARL